MSRQPERKREIASGSSGTSDTGRRVRRCRRSALRWVAGSKIADQLDGVAEQVEPHRIGLAGGKDVDDAAAHGVFARLHDRAGAAIAAGFQEARELLGLHGAVGAQLQAGTAQTRPVAARAAPARSPWSARCADRSASPAGAPAWRCAPTPMQDSATRGRTAGSPRRGSAALPLPARTKASASASRAIRASSRVTCRTGPANSPRRRASRKASQPSGAPKTGVAVIARPLPRAPPARGGRGLCTAGLALHTPQHRAVRLGRDRQAPGEPVRQVVVRQFQQCLQRRKLRLAHCALCAVARSRPSRMSFSYVPRWVARYSRRRRLASMEADSGSLIGAVSYSRAITRCQPVDHDPLTPLFAPLTTLKGVGPPVGDADRQGGRRRTGDRPAVPPARSPTWTAARARPSRRREPGQVATLAVEVVRHEPPANAAPALARRGDRRHRLRRAGVLRSSRSAAKRQQMPPGAKLLVSGKLELFNGRLTMPHPDHVVAADQPDRLPAIEPVWPLTAGLWPRQVATAMARGAAAPARACPNGTTRPCCGARTGRPSPRRCARCRPRQRPPATVNRVAASPMTNCWPDQVALARGARPGARPPGPRADRRRRAARQGAGAVRPSPTRLAGAGAGGDRRRPGVAPGACCGCCKAMSAPARRWWRC